MIETIEGVFDIGKKVQEEQVKQVKKIVKDKATSYLAKKYQSLWFDNLKKSDKKAYTALEHANKSEKYNDADYGRGFAYMMIHDAGTFQKFITDSTIIKEEVIKTTGKEYLPSTGSGGSSNAPKAVDLPAMVTPEPVLPETYNIFGKAIPKKIVIIGGISLGVVILASIAAVVFGGKKKKALGDSYYHDLKD